MRGQEPAPAVMVVPPPVVVPVGRERQEPASPPTARVPNDQPASERGNPVPVPAPNLGAAAEAAQPGGTAREAGAAKAPVTPVADSPKRLGLSDIVAAKTTSRAAYLPAENDRVLILDMPSMREQGRMFARIIIFVERGGTPKTRIMTVPEIKEWLVTTTSSVDTLTVGNNLRASELARFFNTARNQGEPLTVEEAELYDSLLQWQVLRELGSGLAVVQPERLLITISQASSVNGCAQCTITAAQRGTILQHEMAHAKFATDTVYQDYSLWFWSNTLSPGLRERFTQFLIGRGYDSTNRELMANEAQAFLMHTPDPAMFSAASLGLSDRELNELRQAFLAGIAAKPLANANRSYRLE